MTNSTTTTQLITKLTMAEVSMAEDRKMLDAQIKKLIAERDAIDEKLRQRLEQSGAHLATFRNGIVVEMRPWTRTTLDAKRLRLEQPNLVERYERTSTGMSLHYV
jgi:predicted phage-related endonuclease